jgi:addiction module HigA family antidote
MSIKRHRRPTAPGKILRDLYLEPRGIGIAQFAAAVGVSRKHMSAVVNERAAVTAPLAARIALALGTSPQFWLNMQNAVDLHDAAQELAKSDRPVQPLVQADV